MNNSGYPGNTNKNMKKIIPVIIIAALLISGVAYAGYRYAQEKKTEDGPQNGQWKNQGANGSNQNATGARRNAGGMVAGEISAVEADNLTLKLSGGGSKIVFYSDSTKITSYIDIGAGDLAVGDEVTVVGSKGENDVTAQSVQVGSQAGDSAAGRSGGQNAGSGGPKNNAMDRGGAGNGNMAFVSGKITAIADKIITVKSSDGGEKSIALAETAKYSKISDSTANDLASGKIVIVNGTSNTDGSVTAESIQIRPELPVIPKQNQLQNAPQRNVPSEQNDRGGSGSPGGTRARFQD
jgi:hypothetical protein